MSKLCKKCKKPKKVDLPYVWPSRLKFVDGICANPIRISGIHTRRSEKSFIVKVLLNYSWDSSVCTCVKMSFVAPFYQENHHMFVARDWSGEDLIRNQILQERASKSKKLFSCQGLAHLVLEIFHLKLTLKKGQNGIFHTSVSPQYFSVKSREEIWSNLWPS